MDCREKTQQSILYLFVQHPVAHTQFIDKIPVISRSAAQLLADICHIYLEFFTLPSSIPPQISRMMVA